MSLQTCSSLRTLGRKLKANIKKLLNKSDLKSCLLQDKSGVIMVNGVYKLCQLPYTDSHCLKVKRSCVWLVNFSLGEDGQYDSSIALVPCSVSLLDE